MSLDRLLASLLPSVSLHQAIKLMFFVISSTLVVMHVVSLITNFPCLADLRVICGIDAVPGSQRFFCDASNPIASITCSFDGGVAEICSFPVVAEFDRFGTDSHTLVVTLVDVFGQSTSVSLDFTLIERMSSSHQNL